MEDRRIKTRSSRRNFVRATLASAATLALPPSVRAQTYPSHPIRLICPFTAGGSTDAVMRAIAESAGKILGGMIVVDNKTGAGGTLGVIELVNARPDGYTLSQLPISILRIPHMQKVQFDPIKDVTYICCLT